MPLKLNSTQTSGKSMWKIPNENKWQRKYLFYAVKQKVWFKLDKWRLYFSCLLNKGKDDDKAKHFIYPNNPNYTMHKSEI